MSDIDLKAIARAATENRERLSKCTGPHEFVRLETRPFFPRYRCAKCGGEVDWSGQHWYQLGLQHGKGVSQ